MNTNKEELLKGQYVVFYNLDMNIFSIEAKFLKTFIITEDIKINKQMNFNKLIYGIGTIRQEPVPLIIFDKWLNINKDTNSIDIKEYKLILLCEINNKKIGILAKNILEIIKTNELHNNNKHNNKDSKIKNYFYIDNEKKEMAQLVNFERLIQDIKKSNNK